MATSRNWFKRHPESALPPHTATGSERYFSGSYRKDTTGDPPLTSLVVHAHDGKVGDGYKAVLEIVGGPPIADELARERHAAEARLTCYRRFSTDLPADGGTPALSPKLQAAVERSRQPERAPRASCPRCHLQLPATGVCDSCG